MFIVSFMIGLIIVISSIFVLRNEMNRAYIKRAQIVEQAKVYKQEDLFSMLENLETSFQEMNNSFYDIIADLEGNVGLNKKEIENINKILEELQEKQQTIHHNVTEHVSRESNQHSDLVMNLRHMANIKENKNKERYLKEDDLEVANAGEDDKKGTLSTDLVTEEIQSNEKEDLMSQIILLRSQGYALTEIAKKLGIGMGEIKLLIHMNDKK